MMLRGNLETSVHTMYSHQLTARLTGLASGIKRAALQMYSDLFVDVLSGNDTFWVFRVAQVRAEALRREISHSTDELQ